MPCTYKKVDSKAGDLLTRGFAKSGTKFTAKAKTATGVVFTAEAAQKDAKSNFDSKLSAKFKHKASGFSVDKFEIDSKGGKGGIMTSEVSLKEPSMPGTRFTLKTVIANKDEYEKEMAEVGVEYSDDMMLAHLVMDPVNFKATANAVLESEGFLCGFEATTEMGDKGVLAGLKNKSSGSLLMGFKSSDYQATLKGGDDYMCNFKLYNRYSDALELSTSIDFNALAIFGQGNTRDKMCLKGAAKYSMDKDTYVQASTNASKVTLAYSQKIFPQLKFTGSATVDMKMTDDNKLSPYTGLGLQFDFGDI